VKDISSRQPLYYRPRISRQVCCCPVLSSASQLGHGLSALIQATVTVFDPIRPCKDGSLDPRDQSLQGRMGSNGRPNARKDLKAPQWQISMRCLAQRTIGTSSQGGKHHMFCWQGVIRIAQTGASHETLEVNKTWDDITECWRIDDTPRFFSLIFCFSNLKKDAQVSNFTPFYLYVCIYI